MRRTGIEPDADVGEVHTAAQMQAAGKGRERRARGGFVAGAELDDVPAIQAVEPVKDPLNLELLGEPRRGLLGDEVGAQPGARISERAADDLLHLALVKINARTKHGGKLSRGVRRVEG